MSVKFAEIDKETRASMTAAQIESHDRQRVELVAQCELGSSLRLAREREHMTQTELATRIGIAQSALSLIEAGRRPLTVAMLRRIAGALGLALTLEGATNQVVVAPAA